MRSLRLGLVILGLAVSQLPSPVHTPMLCMGALHAVVVEAAAQSQERSVPDGEWCQRAPVRSEKAHACDCHQTKCDDPDASHVPAHTDPKCLDYCAVDKCACPKQDCP